MKTIFNSNRLMEVVPELYKYEIGEENGVNILVISFSHSDSACLVVSYEVESRKVRLVREVNTSVFSPTHKLSYTLFSEMLLGEDKTKSDLIFDDRFKNCNDVLGYDLVSVTNGAIKRAIDCNTTLIPSRFITMRSNKEPWKFALYAKNYVFLINNDVPEKIIGYYDCVNDFLNQYKEYERFHKLNSLDSVLRKYIQDYIMGIKINEDCFDEYAIERWFKYKVRTY